MSDNNFICECRYEVGKNFDGKYVTGVFEPCKQEAKWLVTLPIFGVAEWKTVCCDNHADEQIEIAKKLGCCAEVESLAARVDNKKTITIDLDKYHELVKNSNRFLLSTENV